ncbi:ABC transporter permease [Kineosporia sp. R_H_3]|uniref:ABC transporter permease n=1 Tax=Kineosporia sp. R_H_3 TaxID=1961848 RepID=UPI000B4A6CC3|nr:ABC transporter permease [Kineosporia sp. R_H_3]
MSDEAKTAVELVAEQRTEAEKAAVQQQADALVEGAGISVDKAATVWQRLMGTQATFTFVALLALVIGFSVMGAGKFNTGSNFVNLAQNVAILTVLSIGATFVIVTAGVDLSVPSAVILGEVFAVKALSFVTVGDGTGVDVSGENTTATLLLVALAGSLFAGLTVGLINGFVVGYLKVPALIATLGTLGAGLGVAFLMQNGVNVATYALAPVATGQLIPGLPNLVLVAVFVALGGGVLLHLSVFGRHTYAIGSNEEAARRSGIKVERHLLKVYAFAGLMSGLGGYLSVAYFSTTSVAGHSTDNLNAITAAALGGTSLFGGIGTIVGTVIGVWIPAVLNNGLIIVGVQAYWQLVVVGFVLILAVWSDQLRRRSRSRR